MNILNKYFEKIFLITLKGCSREPIINQRLKDINLDYETIYGINGIYIDDTPYRKNKSTLSHGMLGCALSHMMVYEKIINNYNNALIIEDDCVFLDNLKYFDDYYNQLPSDWGLVYLGWMEQGRSRPSANYNKNIYKVTRSLNSHIVHTHCYAITKEFAEKAYNNNKLVTTTADGVLDELVNKHNEVCYCIFPSIALQDNQLHMGTSIMEKIDDIVYKRKEHPEGI